MPTTKTIRNLPLSALMPAETNVRTVRGETKRFEELKASILAHDIIQNLLVRPVKTDGRTRYLVIAGRRRLDALRALAAEGRIDPARSVPCRITKGAADDTELSLAENAVRLDMHPADQVSAFTRLADAGMAPATIAERFGISPRTVEQRLRLGGLAPEILDAARAGRLNQDAMTAFAATVDRDRQVALWNRIKDNDHTPHTGWIRQELTRDFCAAGSSRARFVGLDAYREAGGRIDHDLFTDEGDEHALLIDPQILDQLAGDKLEEAAALLRDAGWSWTEAHLDLDWNTLHAYGRITGTPLPPTDEQRAECERIDARLAEIEAEFAAHGEEWQQETAAPDHPAVLLQEEFDHLENRRTRLEMQVDERASFTPEQMACAGCIVTIQHGGLEVHQGLVRAEDAGKVPETTGENAGTANGDSGSDGGDQAPNGPDGTTGYRPPIKHSTPENAASQAVKAAGLTNSLAEEQRLVRNAMVKAHLADDFEAAFDLAAYQMAVYAFDRRAHGPQPLSITLAATSDHPIGATRERDTFEAASPGIALLARNQAELPLDWLEYKDPARRFAAFVALDLEDRRRLFAAATARALTPQLSFDHAARPEIEATVARLDIPFAALYRPDADRYWSRMRKGEMLDIARRTLGAEWVSAHAKDKKDELAAALGAAFGRDGDAETLGLAPAGRAAALAWTPTGFGAFDPARPPTDETPENGGDDHDDGKTPEPTPGDGAAPDPQPEDATAAVETLNDNAGEGDARETTRGKVVPHPVSRNGNARNGDAETARAETGDDASDEAFDPTPAADLPAFLRN